MPVLDVAHPSLPLDEQLLADLTRLQREAVTHEHGPLLIIAGAGTGKTTVITKRIAWLLATQRATPREILALTFTEKAAAEMEERVDLLVPYGYLDMSLSTFHAFGDRVIREHAVLLGISPHVKVLSKTEQVVFLKERLFDLPLASFRPLHDPTRYAEAIATLIGRAKDEAVTPEEFLQAAAQLETPDAARARELAQCYETYQRLLHETDAIDFGDQVLLTIQLFERHPDILDAYRRQFRYILVDEFQDTNFAQFRLLQLLAVPTSNITVVADDDQSIYKWRGASISNVVKFLEHYRDVRRVVLTENFRSSQAILDAAYRLIRFNDPNRLEVTQRLDKRLVAMCERKPLEPRLAVFDSASSEADWVARQIQSQLEAGNRQPGDIAILVRSNREADLFLRALNVCGIPWQFSGMSGLFAKEEVKMLLSCLKMLADPEDSISWYHVISSSLYACPMNDLIPCLAQANRTHQSLRAVLEQLMRGSAAPSLQISEEGRRIIERFLQDVHRLVELSRTLSPGQLLYRWLSDAGWLKRHAAMERAEDVETLQVVAKFFDQLHRFEAVAGRHLPEVMRSLDFFHAVGDAPEEEPDVASRDRVQVLTIHKAKGLEFPVVFLVGLVQGRFPTPLRRESLELPESLIKDLLPSGDYHLQEERRLFYVAMTRAKEALYATASYHYGGRSIRKISQFVLEALPLTIPTPAAAPASEWDRIERAKPPEAASPAAGGTPSVGVPSAADTSSPDRIIPARSPLRLNPHGVDDYLTCPLKFRYSHVLRLPIMRHHAVIYGAALHKAVELFFKRTLQAQSMSEEELLQAFHGAWSSEGFLSREHEEQRLAQGREALKRFFAQQQQQPERPTLIEEKFSVPIDDFMVVGRWDRVDCREEEAVIIDYKSSDVTDQARANRRVKESLQMAVYALAWFMLRHRLPSRLELRFLETGIIGQQVPTDEDLAATKERLREVAQGVRALEFSPKPDPFSCRWCAYQSICPFAAT